MKKLALLAMLMMCMVSASAQWKVTPEAGANVTKYEGDTPKMGFKAGAAVSYTFDPGWFSIQSGLYYVRRGMGESSSSEVFGTALDGNGNRVPASIYLSPAYAGFGGSYYSYGESFIPDEMIVEGARHNRNSSRRDYIQLPVLARFNWKIGNDVRAHVAVGPYLAVGVTGNQKYEMYEISRNTGGLWPTKTEINCNPFNDSQLNDGYEAPRFDWGMSMEVGLEVKRVSLKAGYDMGLGKRAKGIDPSFDISYHTFSFTVGYTF